MTTFFLALLLVQPPAPEGSLCPAGSPDHGYTIQGVAYCQRRVPGKLRASIFARYGIPRGRWHLYELDHVIPLCLGGGNGPENLWPELWVHAKRKDVLESRLCRALKAGKMTQAAAVVELRWVLSRSGP